MLIIGLDGKEHQFKFKSKPRNTASKLHIRARNLLNNIFPRDAISEEVMLPGTKVGWSEQKSDCRPLYTYIPLGRGGSWTTTF